MRLTYYVLLTASALLLLISSKSEVGSDKASSYSEDVITLRGTVTSVESAPVKYSEMFLRVHLKLTLVNTRSAPLIILAAERPEYHWGSDDGTASHPFLYGALMFKRPELSAREDALADAFYGPSDYGDSPEWKALRTSLDKPRPPADKVRILMPNDEWHFEDVLRFSIRLQDTPSCNGGVLCPPAGWETIQPLKVVWLRALLEIWPVNLEPHPLTGKESFGHMLQKRWLNYGVLQLDSVSEPIKFDLSEIHATEVH
jgi:hypothetical protein